MKSPVTAAIKKNTPIPLTAPFFMVCLALCSLAIAVALTGAWEISLAVLLLSLFLITGCRNQWNIFLLISICVISFLELSFGVRLGSVAGMSLMNAALGLSLLLVMVKNLKNEKRLFQPSLFNWLLLILGLYKFVSLLWTYLKGEYADRLPVLLISLKSEIDPFLIFLIAFNLPDSRKDIKKIVHFLLVFYVIIILANVLNYYVGVDFLSFAEVGWGFKEILKGPYQPGLRLTGAFKDPNLFAAFLVLFFALTVAAVFYTHRTFLKLILAVFVFFQVLTLVLTGSRGGYAGFVGLLLVLFFTVVKKKFMKFKRILFHAGLLLFLMATVFVLYRIPFLMNVLGRLQSENIHNVITVTSRLELWKTGMTEFLNAPLFGQGWKNSVDLHNTYIFYLATLGLGGFGLYMLIYLKLWLTCWRGLEKNRFSPTNYINLSFLAGFGGLLVIMNFIGIYYVYHYLFFYAGIIMKYNQLTGLPAQNAHQGREENRNF